MTKQLTCAACGVVVAEARYRRWPGSLVLVSPEGHRVEPEAAGVQLRRARAAAEGASAGGAARTAARRADFLEHHLQELVYDLRCRNGHAVLRTMPQLVRAVRGARGHWVPLG